MATWVDANPFLTYYTFGNPPKAAYHTGSDLNLNTPTWNADKGKPVHAIGNGVVTYARLVPTGTWGRLIVIRHKRPNGETVHSRYGHLASMAVTEGQVVKRGDVIGTIGGAEYDLPDHLHFDISTSGILENNPTHWPGANKAAVTTNYVNPKTFLQQFTPPQQQPPAATIDLLQFKIADPDCWRVVQMTRPDGTQHSEDVQDMLLTGGLWVRRKGSNGEWHRFDENFFYLVHDTSPDVGTEGIARVYTLYKDGQPGAPKSRRHQAIGVEWIESGTHQVRFRARGDCRDLAENSGAAQNRSVITKRAYNHTFNSYGQGLTFDEVIWEQTGAETQIYGIKDGRSCGWIGWSAPWGFSEPVAVYWNRGRLAQEPERHCSW